ncbi:LOW QUALITY PROTEIN: uncharacterized protein ACBT57_008866 [Dama dama]
MTQGCVRHRGPWRVWAGLHILGNTCYVNAALQCLSHTPPLASWMVSQQHATLCPASTSCTLCAVRAHVTRALLQPGEVIWPRKDLLAGFERHQQEDAHEFLMFTLNTMQQGCLSASQLSGHPSEDTTLIRQIFGGTWRTQIQCVHSLGVSDTFDPYLDISLDITAAQSVEQALRELLKPEKLDAENAYDSGVCPRKVPATKRLTLHSTSQVLVLVLKRFTQVSGAKRAQEVRSPQCLDLQPYTSERKGPLGYVLYAVLVHSGWSCERGHYFSYVRAGNGQWYKMDDAKVSACDESAALSQSAYVLFYSREGAWQGGAGGGAAAPLTADPTHPGEPDPSGPGEPAGAASGRAPESHVSPGDTEVEGISLEQWRRLQEHKRPKPAFDLRKIQSALPAGAVVIHQSNHGEGRNGKLPEQEHDRGPWRVWAGLHILGNTCYVNAALQCLSHTPPLASWMVSQQHATLCPASTSCTLCAVRAHVTRALLQPGEVIRPRKDLLAGFERHQQEDAHEFLMFTLNTMQQGCLSASQLSGHPSEDTTLIRQIFGGTWRTQIQCVHSLGVSDTFDPYLDISLDITAAQSVEQALRELLKPEKLDAENAYDSGVCPRKVPATKRLTLHSTSQVLVLVLKRFTQVSGAKRAQEVRSPQCLDLQPYTSERKGPLGYVLYAVLVHSGWSCERGHYFSYVRAGNGQWYKMDDAKVSACDESAALSQSAYVLFYSREGVWQGGAGGGAAAPLTADPTHPGEPDPSGPGEPAGAASGRAPESHVSPGDTEVEGISLEQWRRLQEHKRPKPAFDLRKIQSALPAGAVVIHQSNHGEGRNGKLPEQEHDRLVGLVCRDPGAASAHGGGECPSPFNVFPGGQGCRPSAAGVETLWEPCVREGPWPAVGRPQRCDFAHGSAGLVPGHQVALNWRGPWRVWAGLHILGNTCYVNAALQCLSHTPPLASWMVSQQHATLCPASTSCTLCAVRAHVTRALLQPGEVIRPRKDLLAGFERHQQEDAHEFLMFTLNTMQQGCLSASQLSGHPSEDTTLIRQIFGGTWRTQIQCVHSLGVSDTFDPYLDISLDITAAQSVEQALRELLKPEKLDAENAYDSGVCPRKVPATKRLTLHSTSQVLVLVLKRFTQVSGAKRAQEVRSPQCLDLQPYTSERKGPLGYVLYAVLVHSGWSCERGHYFSYVRAGNGQWYKMDDAKVSACDESAALSQSAYVLFYSREGAWQGGAGGGAAAPLTADPTHPGEPDPSGPGEPAGAASGRAPESHVSPGDTEVEGISLEQWRRLQEHKRPKPAFDLRKIQSALPAGAVVIHQSNHGEGRNGKLPEQEHDRLGRPRTDSPPPGLTSVGNGPCASGRAATKRKNKKPRPSLGLWR